MTQSLRARMLYLGLILATQLGCSGPILPSRGMTVRLSEAGPSHQLEVESVVASELQAKGFVDAGADGRDTIKKQRTTFYFRGPDDISVFVEIDLAREVVIRVRQRSATFTSAASRTFEELANALDARWPGSVTREPAATK
jgi:hypothetical protein